MPLYHRRVAGRVPVIAGAGPTPRKPSWRKAKNMRPWEPMPFCALLPTTSRPMPKACTRHFANVADAVDVPVILYNVPGRTGCSIPVETVARLARHPNICGIKEASGDISYAVKIARYLSDDFQMFCGNDDITLPLLSLGASGVISVWANIMPAACHQMVTDYLEGRREQALKAQLKYLDLINGLFMEVNPIPVKEAMNLMGMNVGGYRLPLCPMSSEYREKLAGIMRQAGLDVK